MIPVASTDLQTVKSMPLNGVASAAWPQGVSPERHFSLESGIHTQAPTAENIRAPRAAQDDASDITIDSGSTAQLTPTLPQHPISALKPIKDSAPKESAASTNTSDVENSLMRNLVSQIQPEHAVVGNGVQGDKDLSSTAKSGAERACSPSHLSTDDPNQSVLQLPIMEQVAPLTKLEAMQLDQIAIAGKHMARTLLPEAGGTHGSFFIGQGFSARAQSEAGILPSQMLLDATKSTSIGLPIDGAVGQSESAIDTPAHNSATHATASITITPPATHVDSVLSKMPLNANGIGKNERAGLENMAIPTQVNAGHKIESASITATPASSQSGPESSEALMPRSALTRYTFDQKKSPTEEIHNAAANTPQRSETPSIAAGQVQVQSGMAQDSATVNNAPDADDKISESRRERYGALFSQADASQSRTAATIPQTANLMPNANAPTIQNVAAQMQGERTAFDPIDGASSDAALVTHTTTSARSEAIGNINSNAPTLAQSVSRQIAAAVVQLPERPIEIALSPEELGKVRLVLRASEHGMLVTVQAERPETLDLMRRNIGMLATDMRDLGYSELSFSFSDHPQQQSGQARAEATAQLQNNSRNHNNDAVAPLLVPPKSPHDANASGLDLRI